MNKSPQSESVAGGMLVLSGYRSVKIIMLLNKTIYRDGKLPQVG